MKFSSIIISAATVVPAFFSNAAANYLPDSHPCNGVCHFNSCLVYQDAGLGTLWNCVCEEEQTRVYECGNCIKQHASSHPPLKETTLVLAMRLMGALCPGVHPQVIAAIPQLSSDAMETTLAFHSADQLVDSFLELFQQPYDEINTIFDTLSNVTNTQELSGLEAPEKSINESQLLNSTKPAKWRPHLSNTHPNETVGNNTSKKNTGKNSTKSSDAAYWLPPDGWFMALAATCFYLAL